MNKKELVEIFTFLNVQRLVYLRSFNHTTFGWKSADETIPLKHGMYRTLGTAQTLVYKSVFQIFYKPRLEICICTYNVHKHAVLNIVKISEESTVCSIVKIKYSKTCFTGWYLELSKYGNYSSNIYTKYHPILFSVYCATF